MSGGRYYIFFPDGQRCSAWNLRDVPVEVERWVREFGPEYAYTEFYAQKCKRGNVWTERVFYDIVDGQAVRQSPQPPQDVWWP